MIATFSYVFNIDNAGVGYGCFCMFVGLLCFGSWSIGKEEIDPEKPIRNILILSVWSLLGFGITSIGIKAMIHKPQNNSVMIAFLALAGMALIVVYIISIIKNKDVFAILSIVLLVLGCVIAANTDSLFPVGILALAIIAGAFVCFAISFFKNGSSDD